MPMLLKVAVCLLILFFHKTVISIKCGFTYEDFEEILKGLLFANFIKRLGLTPC